MYDKLAVGMSVATVTLLFSFEQTIALAGVPVVPLSVNYLAAVSLLGIAFAGRSYSIELKLYRQEGMALVLAPLGSFLITYVLLYLSWNRDDIMDFAIMSGAIVLLCGVYFFGYSRIQKRHSEAAERMLEVQRNQIYENSRVLSDMELKMVMAENQTLHDTVNMKRQEIMNVALSIVEQKEYLESLNTMVKQYSKAEDEEQRDRLINDIGVSLRQRLSYERDVDSQYFYAQAESLHEDFNAKLSENFPNLTQQERRLATLLRLGFSSKYIATLMNITPKSVEISRYRLRQKLGLERSDNLVNFIKSI
jgi:DNA-binding NarL/FixJ family response regulator